MYFSNLSKSKAVSHSVQQLKIVKIAVIVLLFVQTIEASSSIETGQYLKWIPTTKSAATLEISTNNYPTKAANTMTSLTTKSTLFKSALTTKFTGPDNYCSMCKSHVACKRNNVRSKCIL